MPAWQHYITCAISIFHLYMSSSIQRYTIHSVGTTTLLCDIYKELA